VDRFWPNLWRTFHHPRVRVLGGQHRVSGVRRVHVLGENGWLGLFGSGTHVSRGTRIIMILWSPAGESALGSTVKCCLYSPSRGGLRRTRYKIPILWSFEKSERSLGDEDRLGGDREAVDPETI
jgi:hypothetical protein